MRQADPELFSEQTRYCLNEAIRLAREYNHPAADVEHLLLTCLSDSRVRNVLQELNVDIDLLQEQVISFLVSVRKETKNVDLGNETSITPFLKQTIDYAGRDAFVLLGDKQIFPEHLLFGMLEVPKSAACFILNDFGVHVGQRILDVLRIVRRKFGEPTEKINLISKPLTFQSRLDEKIKILFIEANPLSTSRLRIDEEIRSIQQSIRQSEFQTIRSRTLFCCTPY